MYTRLYQHMQCTYTRLYQPIYTYTCSCSLPPSPRCSSPVLSCHPSHIVLSAPLLPTMLDLSHLISVPPRFALLRPIRFIHHHLIDSIHLISLRRSSHPISAHVIPILSSHLLSHPGRSSHRRYSHRLAFHFPGYTRSVPLISSHIISYPIISRPIVYVLIISSHIISYPLSRSRFISLYRHRSLSIYIHVHIYYTYRNGFEHMCNVEYSTLNKCSRSNIRH